MLSGELLTWLAPVLLAVASALLLHGASGHSHWPGYCRLGRCCPPWPSASRAMASVAVLFGVLALLLAGFSAAAAEAVVRVLTVLASWMLVLVLLPFADAWAQTWRESRRDRRGPAC